MRAVQRIPEGAAKAISRMLPDPKLTHRHVRRVAGLGSLGRQRFVALAQWHGKLHRARSQGSGAFGMLCGPQAVRVPRASSTRRSMDRACAARILM